MSWRVRALIRIEAAVFLRYQVKKSSLLKRIGTHPKLPSVLEGIYAAFHTSRFTGQVTAWQGTSTYAKIVTRG